MCEATATWLTKVSRATARNIQRRLMCLFNNVHPRFVPSPIPASFPARKKRVQLHFELPPLLGVHHRDVRDVAPEPRRVVRVADPVLLLNPLEPRVVEDRPQPPALRARRGGLLVHDDPRHDLRRVAALDAQLLLVYLEAFGLDDVTRPREEPRDALRVLLALGNERVAREREIVGVPGIGPAEL